MCVKCWYFKQLETPHYIYNVTFRIVFCGLFGRGTPPFNTIGYPYSRLAEIFHFLFFIFSILFRRIAYLVALLKSWNTDKHWHCSM